MALLKPQDFINKYMNKYLDTDGYPSYNKYQCVDVIRKYLVESVGCKLVGGNARDYWYNYDLDPTLKKHFTRIKNTVTAVPKLGDIIIWDAWRKNPYGHIAICSASAGLIYFTSFDQNWPVGSPCHYQAHDFFWWSPKVLGWLRPN